VRLIRVFPRRTRATPTDPLAYVGPPDLFAEADEVHVSVTFSWDLPTAERLAEAWERVAPTKLGGPATGMAGGEFVPGRYLREGYTITSRGCPNRCWFCGVWGREGQEVRPLPIRDGWNVLDDNLLACGAEHVRAVFAMLTRQPERVQFTGGLEAARLQPWHVEALRALKPKQIFFAYDTADDLEPLRVSGRALLAAGFTTASHVLRAYVLIGYPRDTFEAAEKRLQETLDAGFLPMAMLYRDAAGGRDPVWARFQRTWARPAIAAVGAWDRLLAVTGSPPPPAPPPDAAPR
jgi:hypothetical protein